MCSLRVVVDDLCSSLKLEAGCVFIVAGFELVLCDSDLCILFLCVTLHDGCLVYNTFLETFSLEWARPCLLRFTFFVDEDCFIVAGDYLMDVVHTAITQFDCIFIVDFIELVFWWWSKGFLSYVGDDVFAIWGVEPSYFSSSPFVFAGFFYFIILYVLGWAHIFLGALSVFFSLFYPLDFHFCCKSALAYIRSVSGRRCMVLLLHYWMSL